MASQMVYGDGWEDVKDCFGGGGRNLNPFNRANSNPSSNYYGRDRSCSKSQIVVCLLAVWLFILTIVCIVLGSQINSTSNAALRSQFESHKNEYSKNHATHADLLDDLSSSHAHLHGKVSRVVGDIAELDKSLDRLGSNTKADIRNKLGEMKSVLYAALDKVGQTVQEIKDEIGKDI